MRSKRLAKLNIALVVIATILCGCKGGNGQGEDKVILEQEQPQAEYTLATAGIDNIVLSQKIRCVYAQLEDENLSFKMGGKIVQRVYVKEGDYVKKGDLIAVLNSDSIDADIANYEYQIARKEMLIKHAEENCEMDIKVLTDQFSQYPGTQDVINNFVTQCDNVRRNYRYQIEDLNDDLEIDRLRLAKLREEKEKGSLYAGISGTVSFVKYGLEGSTAIEDEKVVTIIDNSKCVFTSDKMEYSSYFDKDAQYLINVSMGKWAGDYKLVPFNCDNWTDSMQFTFAKGNEEMSMDVGTTGDIRLILEEKTGILVIPKVATHEADGKTFVYMLGESGIREVHWITTGITGDEYIEVIDGLNEGDKVIVK